MRIALLAAALAIGVPTHASEAVRIDRSVFIERVPHSEGRTVRTLAPAESLSRGDRVVLMLNWYAPTASNIGFVVSSRVPDRLAFERVGSAAYQVSVDGGRTWGPLSTRRLGTRRANESDVTDVRWIISREDAARGRGMLTYSAQVR
ncbi:hypothetical protein MKP08_11700 [Erythrobacter sp. LQ02-29]|uniref:hypothetical protein n=1 Tax=Erythrobacter sp. LQ02-29 TaxID=2920384 RepID=UPI001F4F0C61|nr:hypothetical protein [Erythrobacter sp. LQ02-29]MCP9223412.1 hypothetical protein [Erythrobacter sp. LQ02-29]